MKQIAIIILVLFAAAGRAQAVESGNIPAAQQPMVKEVTGSGKIGLEAAIYPEFRPVEVDPKTEPGCQTKDSAVFKALALQDIAKVSPSTGNAIGADLSKRGVQETDLKISLTDKDIPAGYRKTAKVLVTWTVRIEGECYAWRIGHVICEPWVGTIGFYCPEGDVKTYLKATYKAKGGTRGGIIGVPVVMTMPPTETVSLQNDPTLTGTYVITPEDFPENNNEIPDNLELTILWENFSSLRVHSPDGMRNMIVNVVPVVKSK
ncbi:MAG TPA: hypothetical protein PK107_01085 [Candidatus Omnitrophota bacterium]|nr:hypothetical protein [Candidatus Omnitrophota bacterium]